MPPRGRQPLAGGRTYVKVAGRWRYVYRAIDQFGQVIDVFVSARRDAKAARRFFERAISATKVTPIEVTTDQAPVYPAVLEDLLPAAWHRTDQYANNRVEADHGRLKARLRPMRGLKGLTLVRPQLLPALPAGRPHGPAGRHLNLPPGLSLHHPRITEVGGWMSTQPGPPEPATQATPGERRGCQRSRGTGG
jgi:IS1 family transposase